MTVNAPAVQAHAVAHRLRFHTPADATVDWPASFGNRFLVSVDVEEEFDWSRPFDAAERRVDAVAQLPAFDDRMRAAGVRPLYLADHPVASAPASAAVLRSLVAAGAEIGAQLHAWVNPPFVNDRASATIASFAGNLPAEMESAKLAALVDAVTAASGRPPRAFRAGRYGLGPNSAALLRRHGFAADLSMRARHDYRGEGGPDFTAVGNAAFRWSGLIELPLTTIYTGRARAMAPRWHPRLGRVPHGRGFASALGLFSRVPLTPEGTPVAEALAAIATAVRDGERLLHLSFHSPSLVPGNTPYVRDAAGRRGFDRWWDRVLPALADAGYAPVTLDDVLTAA